MVEGSSSLATITTSMLNLASVLLMANYSEEQLRRKAHLANGGTLANYDRSHYEKSEVENENNNN
jgi:hypothetical protein